MAIPTDGPHLVDVISNILLFFGISGIIVPLLQRTKISSVFAYLICGIIIGPYGLAVLADAYPWVSHITIRETGTVQILGELGIVALMFKIGLEFSFKQLTDLRRYILGLGSLQILVCALVIFFIASLFDNSIKASILIGASFALSSTAIVMKMLEEKKLINRPVGIVAFSILLMQDLAVIPILVLASSFIGGEDTGVLSSLAHSLFFGVITVLAIYFLGRKALKPLFKSISFSTSPEWLAAFVVFIVMALSTITYKAGLSLALGAFMAGMLIAETEFKHEVDIVINPLKGILLGIFFLSVGMVIDLSNIIYFPVLVTLSVIGIYLLKAAIIFCLCRAFRVPGREAAETSIYLAEPGEFALMILGLAVSASFMPTQDVQFFLLVTVVAMMLSPLLFRLAPVAGRYAHRYFEAKEDDATLSPTNDEAVVLIAGFGRTGQLLGQILEEQRIQYIAFDNDGKRVASLKKQGFRIIYGDARKKELWQRLMSQKIAVVVIAIDDHQAARHIMRKLKSEFPLLPVIVRSKSADDTAVLYTEGAKHVVAETLESGLRLTELLMIEMGTSAEEASTIVRKLRKE